MSYIYSELYCVRKGWHLFICRTFCYIIVNVSNILAIFLYVQDTFAVNSSTFLIKVRFACSEHFHHFKWALFHYLLHFHLFNACIFFSCTLKNIRIVNWSRIQKLYRHVLKTLHVYFFIQANLRACNQDLRNHVSELKQELELQKSALMRVEREKVFITYTSYNEQINDLLLLCYMKGVYRDKHEFLKKFKNMHA